MAKVYDTDVGTQIILDTGVDLSEATKIAIYARMKPHQSGNLVELLASVYETTKVKHQKTTTTLNVAGDWELQAYVEFDNGATSYCGERYTLTVYPSLKGSDG